MTTLKMTCGGCGSEQETERVTKSFKSITGRSWGIGSFEISDIEELAADKGWVLFDQYTQCTYCPDCWESINK